MRPEQNHDEVKTPPRFSNGFAVRIGVPTVAPMTRLEKKQSNARAKVIGTALRDYFRTHSSYGFQTHLGGIRALLKYSNAAGSERILISGRRPQQSHFCSVRKI